MPEVLKEFLKNVNQIDANMIWDYLDGEPDAISEMIEMVCESHGLE